MFNTQEIIDATKGKLIAGDADAKATGVSIDSRTIKKGEVFVAIKGKNFDGHNFIESVVDKASIIIVGTGFKPALTKLEKTAQTIIKVKDTTQALAQLATYHRNRFNIPVIAITGSAGKTTTKDMVACVLSEHFKVLKSPTSFNNIIGVSLSVLQLNSKYQVAVFEVGTNAPGEIKRLAKIVQPNIAVLTNIGPSHLQGLGSLEGVAKEKLSLAKALPENGFVVYNADDVRLKKVLSKRVRSMSFSINADADEQAFGIRLNNANHYQFRLGKDESFVIKSPVYENIYNALAAICCGQLFDVSYSVSVRALKKVSYPSSRQNIKTVKGIKVIDDSYNANPISFKSAINTLVHFDTKGKRLLVCGDMAELGKTAKTHHAQIGKLIAQSDIDATLAVGKYAKDITSSLKRKGKAIAKADSKTISAWLKKHLKKGDVLLIKGSRCMGMEKIIDLLK